MSIASAISNAQTKVANAYTAVSTKGGTLPVTQNLTNLPTAINSIPTGAPYNGLATSYTNGLATINKGALQDYKVSYVNETGCLAEYVHTCNNFIIFGTPTINFASGAVSGFSVNDYIQLPQSFPTSTYCSTYDIIFQASLTSASDINSLLSRPSDLKFIGTNWETSTYSIYTGSSFTNGTTVLENNKKYWFRAIFDGTNCKGYLLADDDYVLSSLPDISQWSYEWTTTTDIFRGQQLVIGRNYGQSTQYFRGTVNLSQAIIYVNGKEWWSGRGYSAIINNYAYTNYTTAGSPTVDVSTGLASGFSTSNYITLPQSFNPSSNNWEMKYKVRYTSDSGHQRLCGALNNTSVAQVVVGTNANKLITWISSNGSSWDIASGNTGSTTLVNNTEYYIKVEFTGSQYIISLSTDNATWSQEIVISSSTPVYNNQSSFLVGNAETTNYWHGSIDLSETYIKINNEVWWTAENSNFTQTKALLMGSSISSELNIFYNPVYNDYFLTNSTVVPAYSIGNKVYRCSYGGTIDVSGYSNFPCYSISPNWGIVSNGNLTYNSSDMSYSGFNQNNYIRTNYNFEMSTAQFAAGFCIQVHFKLDSGWNNRHNFILSGDGNWLNYSYIAVLSDGKAEFRLASGGSGLFIMNGTTAMQQGIEYWLRVIKPDYYTAPRMELSTDGENWTLEATGATSISADISNNNLRVGDKDNSWYLLGKLYLDGTFIDFYPISATGTTERVWSLIKQTV